MDQTQNEEINLVVRLTSVWTGDVSHHLKMTVSYHLKMTVASGVCVELRWRDLDPKSDLNTSAHTFVEWSAF